MTVFNALKLCKSALNFAYVQSCIKLTLRGTILVYSVCLCSLFQRNRTPLMYAALQGSKAIVSYLLKIEGYNSLTEVDEVHVCVYCIA